LRFLVEELKPRVDAAYRTRTEREHTALVGSSLGGLVSLYAGIAAWRTFGLVAGLSPVVQWGDHDLERRYQTAAAAELPLRMWIDMGTAEVPADAGASQALVDELRRFRDVLLARGYQSGQTLQTVEAQGAAHDERAWSRRLPDALRFLLGPPASR
jgi:enterochelin esterase-like enzyme